MNSTSPKHTTFSLRDVGLRQGQARHEQISLLIAPYVQGGVDFIPEGGGKVPKASEVRYLPLRDHVDADLDVTAMDSGWSFRLRFVATLTGPCSRCLEPAQLQIVVDAHEVHDPDAEGDAADDLCSSHITTVGPALDITSWAQECIALKFPAQVLCQAECRGLCGQCGINLNEHPDHSHEKPTDSRWDALKNIHLGDNAPAGE